MTDQSESNEKNWGRLPTPAELAHIEAMAQRGKFENMEPICLLLAALQSVRQQLRDFDETEHQTIASQAAEIAALLHSFDEVVLLAEERKRLLEEAHLELSNLKLLYGQTYQELERLRYLKRSLVAGLSSWADNMTTPAPIEEDPVVEVRYPIVDDLKAVIEEVSSPISELCSPTAPIDKLGDGYPLIDGEGNPRPGYEWAEDEYGTRVLRRKLDIEGRIAGPGLEWYEKEPGLWAIRKSEKDTSL
jgi:hypothetical protein